MLMSDYPLPAFHFSVRIGLNPLDTSFRDVEGIGTTFDTETLAEGGENRFVHKLPTTISNEPLVLKRAIAPIASPLVVWCKATLEADLAMRIVSMPINVALLDENGLPVRNWLFDRAFPTSWSVESFGSTKNEVAIEQIKFTYSWQMRVM